MPSVATSLGEDGPIVKRQKLEVPTERDQSQPSHITVKPRRSRIFAPFRTIGLVSPTEVPFTSIALGKTTFQITTSVGRCLQTYDLRRGLNLVFLTRPQTSGDITATVAYKDKVIAAWGQTTTTGRGVWVFKRGKRIAQLHIPKGLDEPVKQIVVFGAWIVGCCSTRIEVWKSATYEHYTSLLPPPSRSGILANEITGGICSMPTYVNKIFAGRQDGTVEIWNVSTGKLLYTITPELSSYGGVSAMQPAPALSLLAIAYENGPLIIQDIRADKQIFKVDIGSQSGSITSISFRSDKLGAGHDGRDDGVMATACRQSGDITFWDLNRGGRRMGVLRGAHNPPSYNDSKIGGGISKIEFLPGQSVLLTSGLDNALKSWIFDEAPFSPIPRILHSRSGHAAPISHLQFLPPGADGADDQGKWLLSASRDRSLWSWSLRRDGQSTELSQGSVRKKAKKMGVLGDNAGSAKGGFSLEDLKAPEITCLACSLNRDGGMGAQPGVSQTWNSGRQGKSKGSTTEPSLTGWESVVTGHKGDKLARTWFWGRKKAGRWAFETGDGSEVRSVAISPCGTFALIGSAAGGIDMFNLQSGIHRQRFPARLTPAEAKKLKTLQDSMEVELYDRASKKPAKGQGKHTRAVTGLAVDSLNRTVISSGADGKIKFWDFRSGILLQEIDWHPMATILGMRYHRPNDLIAVSCSDHIIRVVDIETRKLIRELRGCTTQSFDYCFSNDGRWIVASSADSIIRVWDLPTGHMIDAIKMRNPCTALAFSTTGEYLATTTVDSVGVHVWTNLALFTHVPTRAISASEIAEIEAPTASGEGGQGLVDSASEQPTEALEGDDQPATSTIDQLSEDILTLSLVPKARWQNLLHLDELRARNKPIEPPKAPEKAPFFLPSMVSASKDPLPASVAPGATKSSTQAQMSRLSAVKKPIGSSSRAFTSLLLSSHQTSNYAPFIEHVKTLGPAALDTELRSLSPASPYTELIAFVKALIWMLKSRRDYEVGMAWMNVWLRLWGGVVMEDDGEGGEDEEGKIALRQALGEWKVEQQRESDRLGALVGYCRGVVGFLRSSR